MAETISRRIWVLEEGQARQERENLPRERPFTIQVRAGRERRHGDDAHAGPRLRVGGGLLYSQGTSAAPRLLPHDVLRQEAAGRVQSFTVACTRRGCGTAPAGRGD